MRVVHLYDGHEQIFQGRGSVPNVVWNVARGTAQAGHEVTVVERRWRGLSDSDTHDGVHFERIKLLTGADEPWTRIPYEEVTSPLGLARLMIDRTNFALSALPRLRTMDFDVLHVHLPFAANVLITVAPWVRDQVVYTAHLGELRLNALSDSQRGDSDGDGVPDEDGGGLSVPDVLTAVSPDIYLAKRVAHTTVLNRDIRAVFEQQGVDPSTLSIVPNGVDVERFGRVDPDRMDAVREVYGVGSAPLLLFVGTVMPRKGIEYLVRAASILANDQDREFELIVAGEDELDGEYTARIQQLVREAGLDDRVHFPGFVPGEDLPALYALADAFVLPSLEEGFGMTVTEAMAAGTPVVATRVGGVPDQVVDGDTGYLVEPRDASGFADALARVLSRPAERVRMSEAARQRASMFSWEAITDEFLSIYDRVVE